MKVNVREVPARRVAYMRGYGRYPEVLPKLWKRFAPVACELGLFKLGLGLSVMHDDSETVPAERLRGDAAIEVGDEWEPEGGLDVEVVPGGLFAVAEHRGAYDKLVETWGEVMRWVEGTGYRFRDAPSYEVYLNDPAEVAEEELVTEIYLPVEKT
jgi:AraC family transcriptional regulator